MVRRQEDPFAGYREPALPADLPLGEAKRESRWEVWGGPTAHPPPSAPGYARARAMGLLPPPPPSTPPSPVPGTRASSRLWGGIALAFGSLVLLAPLPETLPVVLLVGAGFGAGFWLIVTSGAREEVETAAGYTTTDSRTGLWRLDGEGRVLREPDPSVLPPGWYPSPYYPGLLQRWEGPGWMPLPQKWRRHPHRYFRRPETPFL